MLVVQSVPTTWSVKFRGIVSKRDIRGDILKTAPLNITYVSRVEQCRIFSGWWPANDLNLARTEALKYFTE